MNKPLLAAALVLGFAGHAMAEETQVKTAGVDFRNTAAVQAFYGRLQVAAERVCDSNSANPRVAQLDAMCVQKALAQAVRTADRPLLTALYDTSVTRNASR